MQINWNYPSAYAEGIKVRLNEWEDDVKRKQKY
jgi:hypothetical protein